MAECKLNYTADEINKKLGEVADQVFDSESENAQSGIALKDLVIKELVAEDISPYRFYIQNLEKGIYTLKKSLWTGTTSQRIMLFAGTTSLGLFGKGSILIVNNNSTTTTATGTFRKAFLLIQGGISDSTSVYVRSGTLLCTRIVDVDEEGNEVIDWEYDCSSGNILHSGNKTTAFTDNTDTSLIPTVGAVKTYINDNNSVKLSKRIYETIQEYTVEEEGITQYYLANQKLDSVVIIATIPKVEETYNFKLSINFGDFAQNNTSQTISHDVGQTHPTYAFGDALVAKVDALVYSYNFISNVGDTVVRDSGILGARTWYGSGRPVVEEHSYPYIKAITLKDIDEKAFPVGTKILIRGVLRE